MPRGASVRRRAMCSRTRACTRKTGVYETIGEAKRAAENYMKYNPGSLPRVAYECPYSRGRGKTLHYHYGKELDRHER